MLLYEHPLSPYVQKVKIALREKGVPFECAVPDGLGNGGDGSGFIAANPRAEVPALVDGDVRIFDSTIILEYIEEKWPNPPMLPPTPAERARVRMIEDVCDTHLEAINWGLGEIRFFGRAPGSLGETLRVNAGRQLAQLYRWLEAELGGRDWFNGTAFGWGDLSVAPFLNMSAFFGFAPAEDSPLDRWLTRVGRRPAVAQTFKEAIDSTAGMGDFKALLEGGAFKRQFRDHRLEWIIKSGGIEVVLDGLARNNIRFTGPQA
jgi:glutathione S-transferase/RNA polymerase-associated protein